MNTSRWPKRLYALDVSRGFVALGVVLWHWSHFAYVGSEIPADFARDSQPFYGLFKPFYEAGLMGVQYFFLLSGFIFFWLYRDRINQRKTTVWKFSVQRFSRLYPLHFVTLIAVALLQLLYFSREGLPFVYPDNDFVHFITNLTLTGSWFFKEAVAFNGPVWSVSVEILLYAVFYLAALYLRCGWFFALTVSVLSLALSQVLNYAVFNGLAMFFFGGVTFYVTRYASTKRQSLIPLVYAAAAMSWALVFVNHYLFGISDALLAISPAVDPLIKVFVFYGLFPLTVASLALLEISTGPLLSEIAWVGNITYSSYLLHFPLQFAFALAVSYGLLSADFYLQPLWLVLFFGALVPLSYAAYVGFEIPMQKLVRNQLLPQRREQPQVMSEQGKGIQ